MRSNKRGILLITTLFIVAFLTALTLGFILINRDNLMFASKVNESEAALQAAYAGVNYVMMRFEADAKFGISPAGNPDQIANTASTQLDAFPDGIPNAYGAAGPYWDGTGAGGGGSGYAIPFSSPSLTVYETGATAVGLLNNNDSHFQIHFVHFGNTIDPSNGSTGTAYANDGFDDGAVASGSYGTWTHMPMPADMHSINNLNNSTSVTVSGKTVPPYSAHIIAIGYSHGVTRVVETMLKRVFFSNSAVLSGQNISMKLANGTSTWTIGSLLPNSNNVSAGISFAGGKFQQTGGNISVSVGGSGQVAVNNIRFAGSPVGSSTTALGAGYALRAAGASVTPPGQVSNIGGNTYPLLTNGQTITYVTVGNLSGTLYSDADNTQVVPPKDLGANDVLTLIGANPTSSSGLYIPQNNACFVPDGIWAFRDNAVAPRHIDIYNFAGSQKVSITGAPNTGAYPCGSIANAFIIKNYKLTISPGVNLVVDSSQTSFSNAGHAQGNMILTLSPLDFTSNTDSAGKQVLPILALGEQAQDQIGNGGSNLPASITLGGNLYVQGPIKGYGAVIAQSNTSPPASWVPSGGDFAGANWSNTVYTTPTEQAPSSGSGGLFAEGDSALSRSPNFSLFLYSEGESGFNPVAGSFTNQVSATDLSAMNGAFSNVVCGKLSGCTASQWNTAPAGTTIGEGGNGFLDYGHDTGKLTQILRTAGGGLDKASTGIAPNAIPNLNTSDPNVAAYCGLCNAPVNLYQYAALSNYANTGEASWLNYTTPPSSGSMDPVEFFITSTANQFAQQAYMNTQQSLGAYLAAGTIPYNYNDLTFQGFVYSKGSDTNGNGFVSYPPGTKFGFQGALLTSQGGLAVGDGTHNASQAGFLYDPNLMNDWPSPLYTSSAGGNPVVIQWMVVW